MSQYVSYFLFILGGGFVYVGLGARLVASLEGRGARLWRHPGSGYFSYLIKCHLA